MWLDEQYKPLTYHWLSSMSHRAADTQMLHMEGSLTLRQTSRYPLVLEATSEDLGVKRKCRYNYIVENIKRVQLVAWNHSLKLFRKMIISRKELKSFSRVSSNFSFSNNTKFLVQLQSLLPIYKLENVRIFIQVQMNLKCLFYYYFPDFYLFVLEY